jgi:hypothetical protein
MAALGLVLMTDPLAALAAERGPAEPPGRLTPNQLFGGRALTPQEALAACGPAAAVAFANAAGRPISLDAAVAAARAVGWTPTRGMSGPYGQLSLLHRLSIPSTIEAGVNGMRIRGEVQAGRPVIIRTSGRSSAVPGHYFVAERVDPSSNRFDLAQSALVLRAAAGRRWYTLDEIGSRGTGVPTHTIFLTASSARTATVARAATASAVKAAGPVIDTGGPGARLRAAPGTASPVVGLVADGSRLTDTGGRATVAGRAWKRVTVAGGGTGWIDAGLIRG